MHKVYLKAVNGKVKSTSGNFDRSDPRANKYRYSAVCENN